MDDPIEQAVIENLWGTPFYEVEVTYKSGKTEQFPLELYLAEQWIEHNDLYCVYSNSVQGLAGTYFHN